MFGTVARMRVKPGGDAMLMAWSQALMGKAIPGRISSTVYRSTDDPRVVWLSVVFESEEAYRANAASPEQHRRWQQMRSVLEADPEWFDGHVLMHGTPGDTWEAK